MIIKVKPIYYYLFLIFIITVLIYWPILINSSDFFNQGNDLQEAFLPMFNYIHKTFKVTGSIPLWNTLYFAGTPLVSDPQYSPYYPPHLLFLFFSPDRIYLPILMLHSIWAAIGVLFLCRYLFKLSLNYSFVAAIFYLSSPKSLGFLASGHPGLLEGSAWLPWIFFSAGMILKKPNLLWSLLTATSVAACFYTHTVIFLLVLPMIFLCILTSLIYHPGRKIYVYYLISLLILFGEIAITLLPQLEWYSQTTRQILLLDRDVYPKWRSLFEPIDYVLLPYLRGFSFIGQIDTEKWLTPGLVTFALSVIGFLSVAKKVKLLLVFITIILLLISLNNVSPIYRILLRQDWFVLMRVSTRVWIFVSLLICVLAGFGARFLIDKRALKAFVVLLVVIGLGENMILSWSRLQKPGVSTNFAPLAVYQFLSSDKDLFRVFCTTRCLSQKKSQDYQLELLDGYNTLAQKNYNQQMWQLTQSYWSYYSLSIPPIGLYTFKQIQPDPVSLGQFNTKYIISPHLLIDPRFILVKKIDSFYIYQNSLFLPRAYFLMTPQKQAASVILINTPNLIRLDTSSHLSNSVIISQVYNHNWMAYLDGLDPVKVLEKSNALTQVDIKPNTEFIDLKYQPQSFLIGKTVSMITLGGVLFLLIYVCKQKIVRNPK